jgi:general stress protein 26
MNYYEEAGKLMQDQLKGDHIIALATSEDGKTLVRNIDAYYKDGAFYMSTNALSRKMKQITANPNVAFCNTFNPNNPFHEAWMEGVGVAENIGPAKGHPMRDEIREVFKNWYDAHADENNPNSVFLKVTLTKAAVLDGKFKYILDFTNKTAERYNWGH